MRRNWKQAFRARSILSLAFLALLFGSATVQAEVLYNGIVLPNPYPTTDANYTNACYTAITTTCLSHCRRGCRLGRRPSRSMSAASSLFP